MLRRLSAGGRIDSIPMQDRGMLAQTAARLMLGAAAVCMIGVLVLPLDEGFEPGTYFFGAALIAVCGAISFRAGNTISDRQIRVVFLAILIGTMAITYGTPDRTAPAAIVFYAWSVFFAAHFLPARQAYALSVLISAGFAGALALKGFSGQDLTRFGIMGFLGLIPFCILVRRVRGNIDELSTRLNVAAQTDSLTGLVNRRGFELHFRRELSRARVRESPLSLILVDLDHFKSVNDRLGHEEGDRVLARIADTLADSTRSADTVARFGGEEFAVLLPGASPDLAREAAERIRETVRDRFARDAVPLTASCGIATLGVDADDAPALMRAADVALYASKLLGRNRTSDPAQAERASVFSRG